VKEEKYRGGRI